jgi:hypothetical protein
MTIAEVIPKGNYVLYIKSEDGKPGLFDVRLYLDSEAFSPLKDKTEFERLHNGKYFIEWDCGATYPQILLRHDGKSRQAKTSNAVFQRTPPTLRRRINSLRGRIHLRGST